MRPAQQGGRAVVIGNARHGRPLTSIPASSTRARACSAPGAATACRTATTGASPACWPAAASIRAACCRRLQPCARRTQALSDLAAGKVGRPLIDMRCAERAMRIGIDFDNTIACYDGVFHAVAVERGLDPAEPRPRQEQRPRPPARQGREDDFTVLQGYVYGPAWHARRIPACATCAAVAAGHAVHLSATGPARPLLVRSTTCTRGTAISGDAAVWSKRRTPCPARRRLFRADQGGQARAMAAWSADCSSTTCRRSWPRPDFPPRCAGSCSIRTAIIRMRTGTATALSDCAAGRPSGV